MSNEARFADLQSQYRLLSDQRWTLDNQLQSKYGSNTAWFVYCSRGESKKRDALRNREHRVIDRIFALIDSANPTNTLHTSKPLHEICSKMTWEQVMA